MIKINEKKYALLFLITLGFISTPIRPMDEETIRTVSSWAYQLALVGLTVRYHPDMKPVREFIGDWSFFFRNLHLTMEEVTLLRDGYLDEDRQE